MHVPHINLFLIVAFFFIALDLRKFECKEMLKKEENART